LGYYSRTEIASFLEQVRSLKLLRFHGNPHSCGGDIKVYCPYHAETVPSLSISLTKGVWNCFSCKQTGTVAKLCLQLTGRSLRGFLGSPIAFDYTIASQLQEALVKQQEPPSFPVLEVFGDRVPALTSRSSYTYLSKRGLQENIISSMQMEYSPELCINKKVLRDQIIIPMFNARNELIGAEFRSIYPEKNPPKVQYPPRAKNPFYDDHNLDRNKPLYIVEGLMDLARLREDPQFSNSTTTFGTGLSDYVRSKLVEFDRLVIIPDNDKPGWAFVERLQDLYRDKVSVLEILDKSIKDVGDIPIHIRDFYNQGGFKYKTSFAY